MGQPALRRTLDETITRPLTRAWRYRQPTESSIELVTIPLGQGPFEDGDDDPVWTQRTTERQRPSLPSETTLPRPTPPPAARPRLASVSRGRSSSLPPSPPLQATRPPSTAPARPNALPPLSFPALQETRIEYYPPRPLAGVRSPVLPAREQEALVVVPPRSEPPPELNAPSVADRPAVAPEPTHVCVAPSTFPPPSRRPWLPRLVAQPWLALLLAVSALSIMALGAATLVSLGARGVAPATRVITAAGPDGLAITEAQVSVDGVVHCAQLPCVLELRSARHWLTVRAEGLEPSATQEVITAQEPGGRVHFDLARRSTAPLPTASLPVEAGGVRVVRAPEAPLPPPEPAQPRNESSTAAPPAPAAALAPRVPRPAPARTASATTARLNINSVPAANIVLNGRPLGQTPKLGVRVSPGAHTVVFVRGSKRVVRTAVVRDGQTLVVASRL